jgi:hypothetical protein
METEYPIISQEFVMSYVHVLPMPKFIQETVATRRKLQVQHSTTATQAVKAFMIYTGSEGLHDTCFSILVCHQAYLPL